MKKRGLTGLIFVSAFEALSLLTSPNLVRADPSTSHDANLNILPIRNLYVNEDYKIIGVSQLGGEKSSSVLKVYKDGMMIPMTADIQEQYYMLLNPEIASKAGIDWKGESFWYRDVDPSLFNSYKKTLEEYAKEGVDYSIGGNSKVSVEYTDSGDLLFTITGD